MTGSNSISGFNTVTNAVSLLDAMHKKYYPKQYPHRSKAYSVDAIPKAPKMGTAVVHSKSAQFASDTIGGHSKLASDRYSDSNVQYRLSPNSPVSVLVTQRSHSLSPVSPAMRAGCHSGLSPQSCHRKQHSDSSHSHPLEGALSRTSGGQSRNHSVPEEDQAGTSEKIPAHFNTEEAEIEALESCKWLRAAGFPQYAQMYEDGQFPVDITAVQKDHDFLDEDDIQALFRRLNILNRCATMKVEHPASKTEESDEDEQCALSDKWKYESKIQRWSRCDLPPPLLIQNGDITETGGIRSCSSHDSLLSDDEGASNQDSPPLLSRSHHMSLKVVDSGSGSSSHSPFPSPNMSSLSPSSSSTPKEGSHFVRSPRLVRAASERLKGAKNFLKRMESFKSKKKKKTYPPGHKLEIGDPVLVESPEVQARINQLGCVDLSPDVEDSPFLFPDQSRQRPYSGEELPLSDSDASPIVEKREIVRGRSGKCSQNTGQSEHMTVQADYKPGSFPRILANGNVNLISGSERSYRTGSFEGDSAEVQHRQNVLRRTRSGTDEVRQPGERRAENRQSFYDNVPLGELDPQKELDLILQDLYKDISGLSQSLGESEKDSISDELTGPSEELQRIVFSLANQGDEDSIICLEPITKLDIPRDNQWTSTTSASSSSQQLKNVVPDSDFTDIQPSVQEDSISDDRHNSLEEPASEKSRVERTDRENEVTCKVGLTDKTKTDMEVVSASGADFDPDHVSASSSNQESSEGDSGDRGEHRERRDSGVGSSLTRAPSDRKRRRIRWHSFMKSHRPSFNSRSLQISGMSASQMLMLQKYSLLRLTAIMEKHTSPARSGWNLNMPKFLKRTKTPDYTDRKLFGVPLLVILQRTGQPLPQCILYAMRCLRRTAMDAVGIFRKSGVRSRIQKLRDQLEVDPALVDFEALQSYDVADLFKQYFRELPECLLTNKLSETFTSIFISVPHNERLMAMQYAVIQLPDEHREVLHTLLLFLSDMAKHSSENQMNASNLAVCFAPSLFNMYGTRSPQSLSPKRTRKLTVGLPDARELQEQKAAHECLTNMIENCKRIFTVPLESLGSSRLSAVDIDESVPLIIHKPSPDTEPVNYTAVMESYIQELLKDARDKFRGWTSLTSVNQVDIFYKKTSDSNPLRHWRVCTDIEAPPVEVLNKVLRERSTWDDDYLEGTCIERIGKQTEVYHWMVNSMAPHPAREYVELRHWQTDVSPKGASVLVSKSAEHPDAPTKGGVPGVVMASHYLIEPCGAGKSRVHHINRSDTRGRTPDWYNRAYGHFAANLLARVRESFKQGLSITNGPETKV